MFYPEVAIWISNSCIVRFFRPGNKELAASEGPLKTKVNRTSPEKRRYRNMANDALSAITSTLRVRPRASVTETASQECKWDSISGSMCDQRRKAA